jgi:hypothetical protein
MAALEVINVLNEQHINTRRPLGMATFTNPEELETGANVWLHAAFKLAN